MDSTEMKLSDFGSSGNATSLKALDTKGAFTIINVVDSAYDDTPGVRLTTKEKFQVDGSDYNEFYTTRKAIVDTLSKAEMREGFKNGKTLRVKIDTEISKSNHKPYFVLREA